MGYKWVAIGVIVALVAGIGSFLFTPLWNSGSLGSLLTIPGPSQTEKFIPEPLPPSPNAKSSIECERGSCLQNPLSKSQAITIGHYTIKITKASATVAERYPGPSHGYDIFIYFSAQNVGKEYERLDGNEVKLYDNQERQFTGMTDASSIGMNPGFTGDYRAYFNVPSMDSPYVLQINDKFILTGI